MRTQQTYQKIADSLGLKKKVLIDKNANEILFCPSQMMSSGTNKSPLEIVRQQLYSHIKEEKKGVENVSSILERIEALFSCYNDRTVIFSHGFFMRLLHSYFLSGRNVQKALVDIDSVGFVDYLSTIEIKSEV